MNRHSAHFLSLLLCGGTAVTYLRAQSNCGDAPPCNPSDIFPPGAPDCRVDISDLGLVLANFTGLDADCGQTRAEGDIFGADGCVNLSDLGQMLSDFGSTCEAFEPQPIWPGELHSLNNIGYPNKVIIRDVTEDGIPDLVFSTSGGGGWGIAPGRGDGTLGPAIGAATVTTTGNHTLIGIADMDGDGIPDIVGGLNPTTVATPALTVAVRENGMYPTGIVSGPSVTRTTVGVIADFNGDEIPDVALGINLQQIAILLNTGDATFAAPILLNINPIVLAAGDLDQDGDIDLVAVTETPPQLIVLKNAGSASFPTQEVFTLQGPHGTLLEIADVTGDGRPDIVTDQSSSPPNTTYYASVFRNIGNGTFHTTPLQKLRYRPYSMALSDLNHDGLPDIAYSKYSVHRATSVDLLINNGAGVFSDEHEYPGWYGPIAIGDLDQDGMGDIVVADLDTDRAAILLNYGESGAPRSQFFSVDAENLIPTNPIAIEVADFDQDGNPDIAAAEYFGERVSILMGNGDASFGPPQQYEDGASLYRSIAAGDFNHDGMPDLVLGTIFGQPPYLCLYLNAGDGTLAAHQTISIPGISSNGIPGVAAADLNGDGFDDIVAVSGSTPESVHVLINDQLGGFLPPQSYAPSTATTLALGDLNGDGKVDIVVGSNQVGAANALSILMNQGDGAFAEPIQVDSSVNGIAIADVDGDGLLDIAMIATASFSVVRNQGAGQFASPRQWILPGRQNSVAAGDVDLDGDVDLIISSTSDGSGSENWINVALNDGSGDFVTVRSYASGDVPADIHLADVDHDGRLDAVVLNKTDYLPARVVVLPGRRKQ